MLKQMCAINEQKRSVPLLPWALNKRKERTPPTVQQRFQFQNQQLPGNYLQFPLFQMTPTNYGN